MFSPSSHPLNTVLLSPFSINLTLCLLLMICNYVSHRGLIFFAKSLPFFAVRVRWCHVLWKNWAIVIRVSRRVLFSLSRERLSVACLCRWRLALQVCWDVLAVLFCRYPPSSRQANQEEGKEWLRSHSTGGLQDTGSQSPLVSPSAMSSSAAGKYHFSNLGKIFEISVSSVPFTPSSCRSPGISPKNWPFKEERKTP